MSTSEPTTRPDPKGWVIVHVFPIRDGRVIWDPVFLQWGGSARTEIDVIVCSPHAEEHSLENIPREPGLWLWEGEIHPGHSDEDPPFWDGTWRRLDHNHVLRLAMGEQARGEP